MKATPEKNSRRKSPIQILNAFLDEETGELLEMWHLMKNLKYFKVWRTSYGNELG